MKKCAPYRTWCWHGRNNVWPKYAGSKGSVPPRQALIGARVAWKGGEYSYRASNYIADHLNDGELWRLAQYLRNEAVPGFIPSGPNALVEALLGLPLRVFKKAVAAAIRPNPFAK